MPTCRAACDIPLLLNTSTAGLHVLNCYLQMSEQLKYELTKTQAELTVTENLYQPKWLGHLAPQAKIHIIWASIFHSLKGPQDGCLGDCVKMATGGTSLGRAVREHCHAVLW